MFDFNPITYDIHMQIDEDKSKSKLRYSKKAVPQWFNINLTTPEFVSTPNINSLQAFFHFNLGDCQIVPANYIMRHSKCTIDIDRNLNFLKISCRDIEEAKRRAVVLAYLTFDMTNQSFVQLSTGSMLEDPFTHYNIYSIAKAYHVQFDHEELQI